MLQCNNQLIIVHYLNYIICNVKALPEKGRFGCFLKDREVLRGALSRVGENVNVNTPRVYKINTNQPMKSKLLLKKLNLQVIAEYHNNGGLI